MVTLSMEPVPSLRLLLDAYEEGPYTIINSGQELLYVEVQ